MKNFWKTFICDDDPYDEPLHGITCKELVGFVAFAVLCWGIVVLAILAFG